METPIGCKPWTFHPPIYLVSLDLSIVGHHQARAMTPQGKRLPNSTRSHNQYKQWLGQGTKLLCNNSNHTLIPLNLHNPRKCTPFSTIVCLMLSHFPWRAPTQARQEVSEYDSRNSSYNNGVSIHPLSLTHGNPTHKILPQGIHPSPRNPRIIVHKIPPKIHKFHRETGSQWIPKLTPHTSRPKWKVPMMECLPFPLILHFLYAMPLF
jgi:hypothetical protein